MSPRLPLPTARIESPAFGPGVQLRTLRGRETISQPFEFIVEVNTTDADGLDANHLVASPVTITFEQDGRPVRHIHGVIAECRDLLVTEAQHWNYQLRVVPRFWLASLVETLEIYQELTVPGIIQKKLELLGLAQGTDFEFRLQEDHGVQEFVVQYKETDLAFLSRLCEHHGISYFFEHSAESDRVVFSDHNGAFQPVAPEGAVHFAPRGDRTGMSRIETVTRMIPALYVERDYNYRNPAADITASEVLEDGAAGGIIEYGAHVKTEAEAKRAAQLRAQEQRATRYVLEGDSTVAAIYAGGHARVEEHPFGDVAVVFTEVRHDLVQTTLMGNEDDAHYRNQFVALSDKTVFRPRRLTPKPRISGMLTGIIDGVAKGQYAEVDDQGRYRVRFMFDTSGPEEGKASRACRMMQPHSGPGYGMHFPLRPGVEVLITFVDGDPDRPIIAGTVPNPQTASPVAAENLTKNVIRTGSGNEIDIDDAEGAQRIKLTTPHANTIFQLGAPNSPEMGAILQTSGASSTLATTGVANVTSFNTTLSAIYKVFSSGEISSVAEKPGAWATFLASIAVIDALMAEADTLLKTIQDALTLDKTIAQSVVTWRQGDLDSKDDAAAKAAADEQTAENALLAAMADDPSGVVGPKTELQNAIADYEAACAKLTADELALAKLTAARDLAARKDQNELKAAKDAEIGYAATDPAAPTAAKDSNGADVEASGQAQTVQQDKWDVDGTEPTAGDKKKALDDKLKAIENDATASDDLKAKAKAYRDAVANSRTKSAEAASARLNVADGQKSLDDKTYDYTEGDFAQGLATARTVLAVARTGIALFNAIVQLIGLLKKLKRKVLKEEAQWTKAIAGYGKVIPAAAALPMGVGLTSQTPPEKVRHTLGSTGNTTVYGEKRLLLHSPVILISGAGSVGDPTATPAVPPNMTGKLILMAEEKALLLSQDTVEVGATKKTIVSSSGTIELLANDTATAGAAKVTLKAESTGDMTFKSETLGLWEIAKADSSGTLELKTCAEQSIKLTQNSTADSMTLNVKTPGSLELSATKTAKLLATTSASITLGADDKSIRAVAGGWSLDMKDADGIKMGKSPKLLEINNDKAVLQYSVMCGARFESSGVTLIGSQVEIKAQQIAKIKGGTKVMLG